MDSHDDIDRLAFDQDYMDVKNGPDLFQQPKEYFTGIDEKEGSLLMQTLAVKQTVFDNPGQRTHPSKNDTGEIDHAVCEDFAKDFECLTQGHENAASMENEICHGDAEDDYHDLCMPSNIESGMAKQEIPMLHAGDEKVIDIDIGITDMPTDIPPDMATGIPTDMATGMATQMATDTAIDRATAMATAVESDLANRYLTAV